MVLRGGSKGEAVGCRSNFIPAILETTNQLKTDPLKLDQHQGTGKTIDSQYQLEEASRAFTTHYAATHPSHVTHHNGGATKGAKPEAAIITHDDSCSSDDVSNCRLADEGSVALETVTARAAGDSNAAGDVELGTVNGGGAARAAAALGGVNGGKAEDAAGMLGHGGGSRAATGLGEEEGDEDKHLRATWWTQFRCLVWMGLCCWGWVALGAHWVWCERVTGAGWMLQGTMVTW